MRILLDECIDEALRRSFPGHDCQTCRYAGMKGLTNGALLAAAELAGFQLLITVDRNMPQQQSLRGREISVIVLLVRSIDADVLKLLIPDVLQALDAIKPGEFIYIGAR